jgi:hypothetical protein
VIEVLGRFGDALHDIFHHANHRANRRHGLSQSDMANAALAHDDDHHQVSHSELLSYTDFLYLCDGKTKKEKYFERSQ